jgi:hypothetical protein
MRPPLALLLLALGACSASSAPATPPADTGALDADASVADASIPEGGGGAPDCLNACCKDPRPASGGACATSDEGLVCETSTACAGGLLLPWSLTCTAGAWTKKGGTCDVGGGVADNGCPTSQPTPGSTCTLPEGTWCQYALSCPPKDCDAGAPVDASSGDGSASGGTGCAPVAGKVGPAFCRSGHWETTPLGSCP